MSEEQQAYTPEDDAPETAERIPSKEEIIETRLANSRLKRKPVSRSRKKVAPIKTEPPDYPREQHHIETGKRNMNEPWRPASLLTARKKQGFRSRWVRKDLLEKRIEEGWTPRQSNIKSRVDSMEQTLIDGRPLSTYVVKRNLVLCDIPEELAASRDAYYKKLASSGLQGVKADFTQNTKIDGEGYGYGKIEVGK